MLVLVLLQGAATGCCESAVRECCVRFGAWGLVLLQGAPCCCRVMLRELLCALLGLRAGAVKGCHCLVIRVLLCELLCAVWGLGAGSAAGCCCENAVRTLRFGCWCRCRVPLQVGRCVPPLSASHVGVYVGVIHHVCFFLAQRKERIKV